MHSNVSLLCVEFSVTDMDWKDLKYCVFAVIWLMYDSLKPYITEVVLTK